MSKENESVVVRTYLSCSSCGGDHFVVGLTDKNELMIGCDSCSSVVASIDKWPDQEMIDSSNKAHIQDMN